MWKKIIIGILALVGTFSVVYAMDQFMSATANNVASGTSGRIGSLSIGDQVNTTASSFRIIMKYNGYGYQGQHTPYLALTENLGTLPYGTVDNNISNPTNTNEDQYYSTSNIKKKIDELPTLEIADKKIIDVHEKITFDYTGKPMDDWQSIPEDEFKYIFPLAAYGGDVLTSTWLQGTINNAFAYDCDYWFGFEPWIATQFAQVYVSANGTYTRTSWGNQPSGNNSARGIRAASLIYDDNIVFSLGALTNSQIGTFITEPKYNVGSPMTTATGSAMNVRYLDESISITSKGISRKKDTTKDLVKLAQGSNFFVHYSNLIGGGQASIVVKDSDGKFYYYQQLHDSNGSEVSSSTWKLGTYELYLANEEIPTDLDKGTPLACSSLIPVGNIEIVKPLKNLKYTPIHGSTIEDPYQTTIDEAHVTVGDVVGTVSSQDGVSPITYDIISADATDTTYKNFIIEGSSVKVKTGTNGKTYLEPGVYQFRVRAYDKNKDPTKETNTGSYPVDSIGESITDLKDASDSAITYGLVSDVITIVVYPSESQIAYTQTKNETTSAYYTETELNDLVVGTKLGEIKLDIEAKISELNTKGYVLDRIELVEPGTKSPYTQFEVILPSTVSDPYKTEIQKKKGASFTSGNINHDVLITFVKGVDDVAEVRLADQVFVVPGGLNYISPNDSSKVISKYEKTFDPKVNANNTFNLYATDNETYNVKNKDVTYCILNDEGVCTTSSEYITITANTGSNLGSVKVTVKPPGTESKTVKVRAMIKNEDTLVTYTDIDLIINPAVHTIKWQGKPTLKTGSTDTWQYTMTYSGKGTDTIDLTELFGTETSTDNVQIYSDSDTKPTFTYTMEYGSASDQSKVTINTDDNTNKTTISINDTPESTITIIAEAGAVSNYAKSNKVKLELIVSKKPQLSFKFKTPDCSASMTVGSTCTIKANQIGTLSITPVTSDYTYLIKKVEQMSGEAKEYTEISSSTFTADTNGKVTINSNNLSVGKYKITFSAEKGTGDSKEVLDDITQEITISNSAFDTSKWKWQEVLDSGTVNDIGTGIGTDGINNKVYEQTYGKPVNQVYPRFAVKVDGVPEGASITYELSDASTKDIISQYADNYFNILKAGGTGSDILIQATVSKTGYSDQIVYLPVKINQYEQKIDFENKNVIKVPNNGECVSIPLVKVTTDESNYSDPDHVFQYSSEAANITVSDKKICSIKDSVETSAKIKVTLAGDDNYTEATTEKTVQLYEPGSIIVTKSIEEVKDAKANITYTPADKLAKAHDTAQNLNGYLAGTSDVIAQINLSNIASAETNAFVIDDGYGDHDVFTINTSTGDIKPSKNITAKDIDSHGSNTYKIKVNVTDIYGYTQSVEVWIHINSADKAFYFTQSDGTTKQTMDGTYVDQTTIAKYALPYLKDGTFNVYTNASNAIYNVDVNELAANDVIEFQNTKTFKMINATDLTGEYKGSTYNGLTNGGRAYVKATMPAGSGYCEQTIYAEIHIDRASQTISFAKDPLEISVTSTKIVPQYTGHLDTKNITITNVKSPTIAKADDSYHPEGSEDQALIPLKVGTAKVTAQAQGDRNYKKSTITGNVRITERPLSTLTLTSYPDVVIDYGDDTAHVEITDGYKSGIPAYFKSSDTDIIEINDSSISDNDTDTLIIKKVGTVDIEVCQNNTGGFDEKGGCDGDYGYITIEIIPNEIILEYEAYEIYTGEELPTPVWKEEPVSGYFVGDDTIEDVPLPGNTGIKDGTKDLSSSELAGEYKINGSYTTQEKNDYEILRNYDITIKEGKLIIKQDLPTNTWYHLEDQEGTQLDEGTWYNKDIFVVIDNQETDAGTYNQISNDKAFHQEDLTRYKVSEEGKLIKDTYFRVDPAGSDSHAGAISDKIDTVLMIDQTDPKIISITGEETNKDDISKFLNAVTLGTFFKPGTEVMIKTSDPQPETATTAKKVEVSGVRSLDYTVYSLSKTTGLIEAALYSKEDKSLESDGTMKFTLDQEGWYRVCAIAYDNAGNDSGESCYDLNVKKIDVDVDKDGKLDFNDTDGDGCPDVNIKWYDEEGKLHIINGDRDYDGIPDINIDSDGDGIPDLDVDTDGDGKPDLNLIMMTKDSSQRSSSQWKPSQCVVKDESKGILEEYCTGTAVKAEINVDTDGDGIPNINIDTIGDFKPHFNIDINGDGKPNVNIGKVHKEWKPDQDCKKGSFTYDTMKQDDPLVNVDSDGDELPDLNIDLDGDGIPEVNIDADGDGIPETNIDSTGDGIPDVNIDTDGDGIVDDPESEVKITEWVPKKNVNGDTPYDTMEIPKDDPTPPEPDDPKEPEDPIPPDDPIDKDQTDTKEPDKVDPSTPEDPSEPNDPSDNADPTPAVSDEEPKVYPSNPTVQGIYTSNPSPSGITNGGMGGAMTGDSTSSVSLIGILMLSMCCMFVSYKCRTHKK